MKNLIFVAKREITEKRNLLYAAITLGLMPLCFPFFISFLTGEKNPGLKGGRDLVAVGAFGISLIFTSAVAIILGTTLFGTSLGERRISFYFTRPLSNFAIWGGKILGGFGIIVGSLLLTLVPGVLPGLLTLGNTPIHLNEVSTVAGWFMVSILTLFGLGLFLGISFRSKSMWLVFDLVALPTLALLAYPAGNRLLHSWALSDLFIGLTGVGILIVAGLFLASAMALYRGRTDIRRSHAALSTTLWSVALIGVLMFEGYSRWVVAANVSDIQRIYSCSAAPQGSWIVLKGNSRSRQGYSPEFLYDLSSGRSIKIGVSDSWNYSNLAFSNDGKRAVWLESQATPLDKTALSSLNLIQLDNPQAEPIRTKLSFSDEAFPVFNKEGSKVAVVGGNELTLVDFQTGKDLGSIPFPANQTGEAGYCRSVFFPSPERVRGYRHFPNGQNSFTEIIEFDLNSRKSEITGRVETKSFFPNSILGDKIIMYLSKSSEKSINLCDGKTGAVISTLRSNTSESKLDTLSWSGMFLGDGRIAVSETKGGKSRLFIFSTTGALEKTIDLSVDVESLSLGEETSLGKFIVALNKRNTPLNGMGKRLLLVDVTAGTALEKAAGLSPLRFFNDFTRHNPGSLSSKLYLDRNQGGWTSGTSSLIYFDPESGERRTILGQNQTK